MKIEEIKILRGPNYWSVRRPQLIQMKLDLEQRLQKPVDLVSSQAVTKRLLPYINRDKKLIYESPAVNTSLHA